MRSTLVRSLHTTRAAFAFTRNGSKVSKAKSGGGRKTSGEVRWFEEVAPYSGFQKTAKELPDTLERGNNIDFGALKSPELVAWPKNILSALFHIGSYKPNQQNELFSKPVSVVRTESLKLWNELLKPGKSALLTGDAGVGKTTLLSQAHAAAKNQGWTIIHISQVEKLLDGSTFAFQNEKTKKWEQPAIVARLSDKTRKACGDAQAVESKSGKDKPKAKNEQNRVKPSTLAELVDSYANGNILITADNINALGHFSYSENTDLDNNKLYHNDLEIVSTLLDLISNPRGNVCVIGATSGVFRPIDFEGYAYAPLTEYDPELVAKLKKAQLMEVGRFNGDETRAYVEFLHSMGITQVPWEELYQYGNGNPRSILTTATNFAH